MSKMITRTLSEEHWERVLTYLAIGLEACDEEESDAEEIAEIEEVMGAIMEQK